MNALGKENGGLVQCTFPKLAWQKREKTWSNSRSAMFEPGSPTFAYYSHVTFGVWFCLLCTSNYLALPTGTHALSTSITEFISSTVCRGWRTELVTKKPTGHFIMYSGITKIYYRKTVGHVFTKPVQIEGKTQKNFPHWVVLHRSGFVCWNITRVSLWLLCNVHFVQSIRSTIATWPRRPKGKDHCSSEEYWYTHVDACVWQVLEYHIDVCHITLVHTLNISSCQKKTFLVFLWLWTIPFR